MVKRRALVIRSSMNSLHNISTDNEMIHKLRTDFESEGRAVVKEYATHLGSVIKFDDDSMILGVKLDRNIHGHRVNEVYINEEVYMQMPDIKTVIMSVLTPQFEESKLQNKVKTFKRIDGKSFELKDLE